MDIRFLLKYKSWLVRGGLVLIGLLVILYWWGDFKMLLSLVSDRDQIAGYLQQNGSYGPVVLFFILMIQVFLAVIPGHAFIVAGGYIYGLVVGAVITLISTVVAGQLAFLLTRRLGRPFVNRIAPKPVVDYWQKIAENQGAMFFCFSFVLPFFPNDLMSFVAAFGTISPKRFLIANFFGRLPSAIFITLIGSHGAEIPVQYWLVIGIFLLVFYIVCKRLSPVLEQRLQKRAHSIARRVSV